MIQLCKMKRRQEPAGSFWNSPGVLCLLCRWLATSCPLRTTGHVARVVAVTTRVSGETRERRTAAAAPARRAATAAVAGAAILVAICHGTSPPSEVLSTERGYYSRGGKGATRPRGWSRFCRSSNLSRRFGKRVVTPVHIGSSSARIRCALVATIVGYGNEPKGRGTAVGATSIGNSLSGSIDTPRSGEAGRTPAWGQTARFALAAGSRYTAL